MKNNEVSMEKNDVEVKLKAVLAKRPPYFAVEEEKALSRVQLTEHKDPVYYNRKPDSNSRYAHKERKIGVLYVAGSPELAVAESFQHGQSGPGTPVSLKEIEERSIHQLKPARVLKLIDAGRLAAFAGLKPKDVIQSKGQGGEGYELTQAISSVCMEHSDEIDGIIYGSSVYAPAGAFEGCNIVLFEGRGTQVKPDGATPLMEAVLPSGATAVEFLEGLDLIVE